jgi:hypothetical protein
VAGHCRAGGSPLYERLLNAAAGDIEAHGPCWAVLDVYDSEKTVPPAATPLAFMAAVHRVVLESPGCALERFYPSTGGTPDLPGLEGAFIEVVGDHRARVQELLRRPVQTNEVARCRALIGGFLLVAERTKLPLRILEIGASAGLNLRWDHYAYEINGAHWGDPESPVRLSGGFDEGSPPLQLRADVVERRGCDLRPVDARTEEGRITLLSHVWADQSERLALLRAAFEVVQRVDAPVDPVDALTWVSTQLRDPSPGMATVVFDTGVMEYMEPGVRTKIKQTIEAAGAATKADSPLAWLHAAPADEEGGELQLTVWPGAERQSLAYLDPYARSIRWRGPGA